MLGKKIPVGSPLIWGALATLALQFLALLVVGERYPGPVISQALQAIIALLAGTACLRASFRGFSFSRSFWRLAASAFYLCAIAQSIGTYHLYPAPLHPHLRPRGIILYFFSFTPLFSPLFFSPTLPAQQIRCEFSL